MEHKRRRASNSPQGKSSKKAKPNSSVASSVDSSIDQKTEVSNKMETEEVFKSEEQSTVDSSKYEDGSYLEEVREAYNKVRKTSSLQVDVHLPKTVPFLRFAACRASEIATIMKEVTKKRPKLAQQQLPYCMRRRAASFNPKRVPRRLRERALKEIQKAKKSKRPSRRHRRRPKNLLEEYNRRQRKFVWLETHIWFAKRFKMEELWGYKIPLHSNDKNVRSTSRAISQGTIIQDLSYYCCVELGGTENLLLSKLSLLTIPEVGMTFAAKMSLNGSREGHTFLYHPSSYPYNAIGPVSFLWKPVIEIPVDSEATQAMESENKTRKLWIWCHPSIHSTVIKVVIDLFGLKEVQSKIINGNNESSYTENKSTTNETTVPQSTSSSTSNEVKQIDMETKQPSNTKSSTKQPLRFASHITWMKTKPHLQTTSCYENQDVQMTLLKDKLVRHRLIGPKSLSILTDTLMVSDVSNSEGDSVTDKKWWQLYYNKNMKSLLGEKEAVWKYLGNFKSSDVSPPKAVIGLTVKDPRLNLPSVKTEVSEMEDVDEGEDELMNSFTPSIASTAIWDEDIRNEVTATKISESELNRIRSQHLVTEKVLDLGQDESRVPVMVIQQPGINGYGAGWDIIAPLGWSMPLWIAFIFRKAIASGLRELKSLHKEMQQPLLPYDFPDTSAGIEFEDADWKQKMTKHYRYPPDKRPSFQKLGVVAPYWMPWGTLVADWKKLVNADLGLSIESEQNAVMDSESKGSENTVIASRTDYFVLRNKKQVRLLKETCDVLKRGQGLSHKNSTERSFHEFAFSIGDSQSHLKEALILIQLKNLKKGIPHKYSGIYLLNEADVAVVKKNPGDLAVNEPIHKLADGEKKKNKGAKKRPKTETPEGVKKPSDKEIHLEKPKIETLFSVNSRKMIGYADGAFSFHKGQGYGIGHCTLIGFLEVLKMSMVRKIKPLVLVRAQNCLKYRLCEIDVGIVF